MRADRDAGAATVETAIGIGSIVAVLALALSTMSLVIGQIRCVDAAVEAARLVSRGEPRRAEEAVATIVGSGARLGVTVHGDLVTTTVNSPLPGGFLAGRVLSGRAHAVLEPGVAGTAVAS